MKTLIKALLYALLITGVGQQLCNQATKISELQLEQEKALMRITTLEQAIFDNSLEIEFTDGGYLRLVDDKATGTSN